MTSRAKWRRRANGLTGTFDPECPMAMRVVDDPSEPSGRTFWYVAIESHNRGASLAVAVGYEDTIDEAKPPAEAAYRDWTKRMAESCGWTVTDETGATKR